MTLQLFFAIFVKETYFKFLMKTDESFSSHKATRKCTEKVLKLMVRGLSRLIIEKFLIQIELYHKEKFSFA